MQMDNKTGDFITYALCVFVVVFMLFVLHDIHQINRAEIEYVHMLRGAIEKFNYTVLPIP